MKLRATKVFNLYFLATQGTAQLVVFYRAKTVLSTRSLNTLFKRHNI